MRRVLALSALLSVSCVLLAQPTVIGIPAVDGKSLNRADILLRHPGQAKPNQKRSVSKEMAVFPGDNVLPQLVEGAYWSTGMTFINMDTRTTKFTVFFVADDG